MERELLGGIESLGHWPFAFQLTVGMRRVSVSVFLCFRDSVFCGSVVLWFVLGPVLRFHVVTREALPMDGWMDGWICTQIGKEVSRLATVFF